MGSAVIEASGLEKSFDDVKAVNGVSFTVESGEFFGFLGPNGAGKTTTINMLTGLARPDRGTITIGGIETEKNAKAAQHLIGVVPDESNLYPELTGIQNLRFSGALYGMGKAERNARADELIEDFGLKEAGGRRFGGYSRGMKRKLTIAAGIVHRPSILFLDEPTTGIDVESARQIRRLIAGLHEGGTTVFLTTHYIEEAQRLCDRIAFIVQGRIVECDTTRNLLKPVEGRNVITLVLGGSFSGASEKLQREFPGIQFTEGTDTAVNVESREPIPLAPLLTFLDGLGISVLEAVQKRLSLEDVFVSVTGLGREDMRRERQGGK
jgi:ABC-2 type transport system ATP-binding protein